MKISILLFFFISTFSAISQNTKGFMGARFFTTIESVTNSPIIYNLRKKKYSKSADLFNYGYRLALGYISERNVAFCFETGIDYSSIYIPSNQSLGLSSESYSLKIQAMEVRTFTYMPKIEFTVKKGLLPMGLSQQIGFGFGNSKIVKRNYSVEKMFPNQSYDIENVKKTLYDFDSKQALKTVSLFYALSIRNAITKHIMLNYGFRYTISFEKNIFSGAKVNGYLLSPYEANRLIVMQKSSNLINFNCGLTYVFFRKQKDIKI